MRTQTPPFYRKVGGLRFVRIGRLQLSFCICRPVVTREVTPHATLMTRYREMVAERTIDRGIPRIVQHQFGPFA